jgi:predicted HD superfamily hydrolase involved in NAD metabolism
MTTATLPAADRDALRALMARELPDNLLAHIDRVVALARELAQRHGADAGRAALIAQAHDLTRAWGDVTWLAEAERRALPILAVERAAPVLLHGPLGASVLRERGWIVDVDVLHAVRHHTTGHPDYTPEAWAMFVADKVEPQKLARRPTLQRVVDAAQRSLQAGALAYLDLELADRRDEGVEPHPLAEETAAFLATRV